MEITRAKCISFSIDKILENDNNKSYQDVTKETLVIKEETTDAGLDDHEQNYDLQNKEGNRYSLNRSLQSERCWVRV